MKNRYTGGLLAAAAAASLLLSACSTSANDPQGSDDGTATDAKGTITLGILPTWTDELSTGYLLKDQLGKMGYDVQIEELNDASFLYAGLAGGDFDIYPSAWPEVTHKAYMEEFGDDIEDLGAYYDGAVLTIAVPDYVTDITSLADLKGQADRFDGQIIGIEPGAGLTKQTQESMIPAYELADEYELVTSSTSAMLATLQQKIDKQEDVVVTLWRPFWANDAFPVRDLEDPLGAMGEPESLHFLATKGFSDKFAEVADYIAKIKLDDAAYGALEGLVTSDEYEGEPAAAVTAWLADHADAYPGLIAD